MKGISELKTNWKINVEFPWGKTLNCCLATVYWRTLLWTLAKQVSYHFAPTSRSCNNPSQGGSKSVIVLTSGGASDGVDRGYTPEGTHPGNKCGLFPPVQSDVRTLSIWRRWARRMSEVLLCGKSAVTCSYARRRKWISRDMAGYDWRWACNREGNLWFRLPHRS